MKLENYRETYINLYKNYTKKAKTKMEQIFIFISLHLYLFKLK